jgi:hypothetical protein
VVEWLGHLLHIQEILDQILAWRLAVLSILSAFPQFVQANTLNRTAAIFFHICFNLLFTNHGSTQCEKLKVPLNKARKIKQANK